MQFVRAQRVRAQHAASRILFSHAMRACDNLGGISRHNNYYITSE